MYDDFFPAGAASADVRKWAISIIVDALVYVTDERRSKLGFKSLFKHRSSIISTQQLKLSGHLLFLHLLQAPLPTGEMAVF